MQPQDPTDEVPFVYSEPMIVGDAFAVGLIPKEGFAEVREDYLEPILATRFPLNYLHPDSIVHLVREAPLASILRLRPRSAGEFVAVLPRRSSVRRELIEQLLRVAGFRPENELVWSLRVAADQVQATVA